MVRALSLPAAGNGDVLCILPGVGEVRRVTALLSNESVLAQRRIAVQQLHGSLPPQQQDEVIRCGWCVLPVLYYTWVVTHHRWHTLLKPRSLKPDPF